MIHQRVTRRSAIEAVGTAITVASSFRGIRTETSNWTISDAPTTQTLFDVIVARDGAYTVGGGGCLIERTDSGQWSTIIEEGPASDGNDLYGVDVTDDGKRVWFVGASGAVGAYHTDGCGCGCRVEDFSGPNDSSNNFRDIAVTGDCSAATVYIADESGQVHRSADAGDSWEVVTLGTGSTIPALNFHEDGAGHAVDTNQATFSTADGQTWEQIGIEDCDVTLYGLDSNRSEHVWICGGGGQTIKYDGSWSVQSLGDVRLRDIEVAPDGTTGLTVGGSGRIFRLSEQWTEETTPCEQNLHAVTRATTAAVTDRDITPDIAVGASGEILER